MRHEASSFAEAMAGRAVAGEHHGNQRSCGSPTLRTETTVGRTDDRSAYTVRGYNAERGVPP